MIRFALTAVLVASLLVMGSDAGAQSTAGAQSLLITPGARADAMGRAYAAIATDATATWWNPAALASIEGKNLSFMHAQLVPGLADDVYYEFFGYGQHVEGWGGLGANFIFLTYGESQGTDEGGNPTETFTSYEFALSASAGTEVARNLAAGLTVKFVYVSLAPASVTLDKVAGNGSTFAADIGATYRMQRLPLTLAAVFQNLGPDIAYIDEDQSDPIGRNLKIGAAYYLMSRPDMHLLGSFDVNQPLVYTDPMEDPIYNAGLEFAYGGLLALRAGYIYDHEGTIEAPTFGIGLAYSGFSFDYASVPQSKYLDERVSKFSLNAKF
jgi:hypothetical protein